MLKSGEGADCIIEVQEQQPDGDGPRLIRKCNNKVGQASKVTQTQQQPQQQGAQSNFEINKKTKFT
jgi:hypothetical protein